MRTFFGCLFLVASLAPAAAGWETIEAKCLLEVGGERFVDGPCRIEIFTDPAEPGGLDWNVGTFSFEIREQGELVYFAFVEPVGNNRAAAWWSEERGQSQSSKDPQGVMVREGACWVGNGGSLRQQRVRI
jgi:hypothetical protein